jgi:hypothetical protein
MMMTVTPHSRKGMPSSSTSRLLRTSWRLPARARVCVCVCVCVCVRIRLARAVATCGTHTQTRHETSAQCVAQSHLPLACRHHGHHHHHDPPVSRPPPSAAPNQLAGLSAPASRPSRPPPAVALPPPLRDARPPPPFPPFLAALRLSCRGACVCVLCVDTCCVYARVLT